MAAPNHDGQSIQHVYSRDYAASLDLQDPLRHMSREFLIPSKAELKAKRFDEVGMRIPQVLSFTRGLTESQKLVTHYHLIRALTFAVSTPISRSTDFPSIPVTRFSLGCWGS